MALLRISRQVYHETALLPFASNTFSITDHHRLKPPFNSFKVYQLQHITSVQLEMSDFSVDHPSDRFMSFGSAMRSNGLKYLPGLQRIHIYIIISIDSMKSVSEESKNQILEQVKSFVANRDLKISIEIVNCDLMSYNSL